MQDPSCPDITGRVLESLGHCGMPVQSSGSVPGQSHLSQSRQDADGSAGGVDGASTSFTARGRCWLDCGRSAQDMNAEYRKKSCRVGCASVQKADGSWGETCESYDDVSLKGKGASTPSQTAWGAMGLMAAVGADDPAVEKAMNWLVEHQTPEGSWDEHSLHRHWFSQGLLSQIPLVPALFPVDGTGSLSAADESDGVIAAFALYHS